MMVYSVESKLMYTVIKQYAAQGALTNPNLYWQAATQAGVNRAALGPRHFWADRSEPEYYI